MKIFFRRIHLYLGLAAGAVIMIACLTGAILVFEKDLQTVFNKERYFVKPGITHLSYSELEEALKKAEPGARIGSFKIYEDKERSAEFSVTYPNKEEKKTKPSGQKKETVRPPSFTVFMNPYTGEVIEKYSYRNTFFFKVFSLHRWLLGTDKGIGKYIVGISTLIFLFIILTGIILWWPKNMAILKRRLSIKRTAGWKRVNHDLHLVLGFYSSILLFVIAFTALAWSFEWFNKGIYTVTGSPLKPPPPPVSKSVQDSSRITVDQAIAIAQTKVRDVAFYSASIPKSDSDAIAVQTLPIQAAHESATDMLYLDQYSGDVVGRMNFADRSTWARVRASFKPIHTGSIWGWPSKILAFLACLCGISFPVTGTIMWLNRTAKKRKQKRAATIESTEMA